jgi:NAD(P) transhydrogenase
MSSDHFDLVVIGAGPAGEKGAAQAAYFGKRVCIIERAPKPGGTAVNTGAIPSKTLRETALYFSGLRQHGVYGVQYTVQPDLAISDFMHRERAAVESEWRRIDENLEKHAILTMQGSARFLNPRLLEVSRFKQEPRRISGDIILIASGAVADRPAGIPFDDTIVVDYESLLRLPQIPRRMIVVGGGIVGSEYATTFAALGTQVTLVTGRERLLTQLDVELSEALRHQMTARFDIAVHVNTEIAGVRVENDEGLVTLADGTTLAADCVLYCGGRVGNTAELRTDVAGVRTDARGFVAVDEHFRSSVPFIYAAGDVIGAPLLASIAIEQARVAVCHAFDLKYKQRISPAPPHCVYTIPEIAAVGETEESARAKGLPYEVGRASFRGNPRGQITGDVEGFIKLVFRADDQRLLGVSIIGEGAAELIHTGMACIMYGGTIDFFIQSVFDYPALSDAYKYAAYDGLQRLAKRVSRKMGLPRSSGEAVRG